ncbi:MAG TPA: thiaminase II [Chloroflexota bacterium]|nr:thiaminase II [Chloroflexota bacterium]
MTDRSFSAHLRRQASPIWEAQHDHPFVRGIGDGTLSLDRFRHWIRQDYVYLIDYSRLFALAAARAPDLPTMERFAELLRATLVTEMSLHRSYAAEFGIGADELAREVPSPTTRGYVDFLLRVAALGDYADLVAALLPCMWGFSEVGLRLADRSGPSDPRFAAWIEMYASSEFADLANWCREVLDRLSEDVSPSARRRLEEAFLTSSRYELAFWEACYNLEQWPV